MSSQPQKILNEEEKTVISPIVISLILGGIFAFFTALCCLAVNRPNISNSINITAVLFFICMVTFGVMYSFIFGIIYVLVLGGDSKNKMALQFTAVCLSVILGVTFVLTAIPSSFVKIFANSVGYFIVATLNAETLNKGFVLRNKDLEQFHFNKSVLLTVFNFSNFEETWTSIMEDAKKNKDNIYNFKIIENGENNKNNELFKTELKKCVLQKHVVGTMCWYYLSSFMAVLISLKYLIHM
jgi:heat shock protein HspQ